ncbi:restriction endonuclease subunit S [Nocardia amikacinitolerans]|uniref:restriction endonuclease subunit S n=1 Tax=Nocardia amikacinitolerans TaxID=756689 RepID=UPI0020A3EB10|nr:restriction endonuclease subunit S [Nocardia amikacinitolerans]MCP2289351.1 type I restriction enzyme, S subunit [Nocardia amikacinitolerans]
MSGWRTVKLGDVLEEATVGHVGSMAKEYRSSGIPFLRSQNVRPHRIDLTDVKFIDEAFHEKLAKSQLQPGDVVTVRTGSPGQTAVIPEWLPIANCSDLVILRAGPQVDARWLSYYMNWATERQIGAHLVGAVQQHFNVKAARNLDLSLPELTEQRAIAEVLGALDDKIALNQKVSATAGELADAQFRSWSGRVSLFGSTYGQVAEIGGGGTPKTAVEEYWGGSIAWATPTDVTGLRSPYLFDTSRKITTDGLAACSSPVYPKSSILMTSRATIGAFAIAQIPTAVNQGFIVVNAIQSDYKWWLYHDMRSRVAEFLNHANGATFLELPRGRFKSFQVQIPSVDNAAEFSSAVDGLHRLAAQMEVESAVLAKIRDELLPLLMSGKLRVKDAEQIVEKIA